jgi:hypothetical protein
MNKKYLILTVILIILAVLIGSYFLLRNFSKKLAQKSHCPIKTYNGAAWTNSNIKPEEFKEIGTEIVEVVVWPQILDDETILVSSESYSGGPKYSLERIKADGEKTEETVRTRIRQLKQNNLKVYLVIYPEWLYTHEKNYLLKDPDAYYQRTQKIALEWAKIAEEEKVEIFSPMNEPFLHIGYEKTFAWHKEILPKLRQVYHGLLAPRGLQAYHFEPDLGLIERADIQFDFSGWDLVAFDVFARNTRNFDEYRQYLQAVIAKAQEIKNKVGAKGIIFGEIGEPNKTNEAFDNLSLIEIADESWQIIFNESQSLVDYLFFWDWSGVPQEEGGELKHYPADGRLKNTLKKLFFSQPKCASTPQAIKSPNFDIQPPGKIIIADDFNNLSQWRKEQGEWQIENGIIKSAEKSRNLITYDKNIVNGQLKIRFRTTAGSLEVKLRRTPQTPAGYLISLRPQRVMIKTATKDDKITTLAEMQFYFDTGWHEAVIDFRDNRIIIKLDSIGVFEIFSDQFQEGVISLGADGQVEIDRVEITE